MSKTRSLLSISRSLCFGQTVGICLCLALCLQACKTKKISSDQSGKDDVKTELNERCAMKHDPGPCKGAFNRYYFDQKTGKCMEFIYGGCQGVVPFETLEDCQAACEK